MALELGCSQLEDPFRGSSLISLLPQTLGPSSHVTVADTEAQDLDSIDNFFKSVAMNAIKGSKQLVEQAQTITKSYSDIHSLCHDDGPLTVNGNDHPNEQRPGPGRKRVKFCLKPPPSTSLPTVDFSSIDNIDDPEEYFSTFEQLECAEKELKKLRGEVSSDLQHHQLTTSNKRRPGRPRRTANYKHRFSFNANTAESETLVESQEEPFDRRVLGSPKASVGTEQLVALHSELFDELGTSQAKNTSIILQDTTAEEGVLAAREKNVANLLETAKNVMREGLQIKSTVAGKMSLPEMGNIYLNQHSLSKSTSRELKGAEISPTKLMSPLEGISALHRRRSLNNPLKDVFSVFPGDDAPSSRDSSVHKSMNKVFLSPVNVSGKSKNASTPNDASCPVVKKGITPCFDGQICSAVGEAGRSSSNRIVSVVTKDPSHLQGTDVQLDPVTGDWPNLAFEDQTKKIIEQPSQLHGTYMKTDTCALNGKTSSEGCYGDFELEDNLIASQPDVGVEVASSSCADHSTGRSLTRPPGKIIGENRRRSGRNTEYSNSNDILRSQENASVQEKAEDTSAPMDISCAPEETISEDPNLENTHLLPEDNQECQAASVAPLNEERKKKAPPRTRNKKKSTSRQSLAAISCPSAHAIPEDQHLENRLNSLSEENNEVNQTKLGAAQNDERKRKATSRTQNKKKCALRQSLAGAGLTWEDGRRKSSRRRFRPLERWRGERLLYGRVHNSLATVIGVKYVASPGKDALKIESFVPDEYSDLLAQAAVG